MRGASIVVQPNIDVIDEFDLTQDADSDTASSFRGFDLQREDTLDDQVSPIMCISLSEDENEPEVEAEEAIVSKETAGTQKEDVSAKRKIEPSGKLVSKRNNVNFPIRCARGCRQFFENDGALMFHERNYHAKRSQISFECHLCRRQITTKYALQGHLNARHTGQQIFKCPVPKCSQKYSHSVSLATHMGRHHPKVAKYTPENLNYPVKCARICKEFFENFDAMTYHMTTYHVKGIKIIFQCHLCKQTISAKEKLRRHMDRIHISQTRFKCPYSMCSKTFRRKEYIKTHINVDHIKKALVKCPNCSKKIYRKECLEAHMACILGQFIPFTRAAARTYCCYLCRKTSGCRQTLQSHMKWMHIAQKQIKCPFPKCAKRFHEQKCLKQHYANKHTRSRRHWCRLCDSTFVSTNMLQQHMNRMHPRHIKKWVSCPISMCREKFSWKGDLKQHLTNKHSERLTPYCYLCKNTFATKQSLRRHMDVMHIGPKRLMCPYTMCSNTFGQKHYLKKHISALHINREVFMCPKCPRKFYRKESLPEHLAQKHGEGATHGCRLCTKSFATRRMLQLHKIKFKHTDS